MVGKPQFFTKYQVIKNSCCIICNPWNIYKIPSSCNSKVWFASSIFPAPRTRAHKRKRLLHDSKRSVPCWITETRCNCNAKRNKIAFKLTCLLEVTDRKSTIGKEICNAIYKPDFVHGYFALIMTRGTNQPNHLCTLKKWWRDEWMYTFNDILVKQINGVENHTGSKRKSSLMYSISHRTLNGWKNWTQNFANMSNERRKKNALITDLDKNAVNYKL